MRIPTYEQLRDQGTQPRFHGAGFTQLYISEYSRLHFWHPAFPPTIRDGRIHDHKFTFKSEVLLGNLTHATYVFRGNTNGMRTLWKVAAKRDGAQSTRCIKGDYKLTGYYEMQEGSEYRFVQKVLHEIIGSDTPTITRMTKLSEDKDHWPRAVADGMGPPDNAFPEVQPYPLEELWELIRRQLLNLRARRPHITGA